MSKTCILFNLRLNVSISIDRKLQEYLTDEMVGLARQLKERSLMISQSVENTEKGSY